MINPEIDGPEGYEEELEVVEAPAKPKGRLGRWLFLLLLLGGLGGGGWYAWTQFGPGAAEAASEAAPAGEKPGARANAQYTSLDPAMVVNFAGGGQLRYLQVSVEVMTRDARSTETLRRHMPAIRNALINLLSERDYQALLTRAGKEELREEALAIIRAEMTQLTGQPVAEDVYFTSFVMQ